MRLDKYLKVSRIFKRRTIAKEIASHDKIMVNGRLAKPASEVKVGDILKIVYGNKELLVRVLDIAIQTQKDKAASMYEVLEEK